MAATQQHQVLGTNFGSDEFPVRWEEGEKELFWIHDDLHIPNPVSPLFFDIGGWWLTCDHMFRRFGTPFACDWIAKEINGYVYTAAIPCDPSLRAEATEYESRYAPRTPRDPEYAGQIGGYLGGVLPVYASNFMQWWKDRLRPEIERNFAYLDGFDYDGASLLELAVLLEDAIDVHDRHWKIHWMLNFAQFASTTNLNAAIAEVGADTGLMGRLQSSVEDRNWDSIEDLWKAKQEVVDDAELRAAFEAPTAPEVMAALGGSERGRRFIAERIETHQRTFGYKSIWSHELMYKLWAEDPAPIIEAIRGYIATDYDYPSSLRAVRDDLEDAKRAVMEGVEGADREKLAAALQLSLNMNPLTPDHHFYVDQGTNARLRVVAMAAGRKLVEAGALADPEDVVFLHYNELRRLLADPQAFDARELVSDRRDDREDAFERRPPAWLGTATQEALDFPYAGLWGFPDRFYAGEPTTTGEIKGLAASPGVVEGSARFVSSLAEFDQVQEGEILVCRMTNPAWVVLFTKIAGLVTEAGGTVSHPAVVAREFGIPAVVGTGNAGERIKTGDRVRVNGATGVVEILG
ncbi:PEP-utilizing enzyme [Candidatus Solirubrobacter pratensis]|uniref:PEP-utilizing enzyme n=1 Tax=Candidatus Solirubrobacter pratensis TaxID=1298857 RepID=UPI00041B6B8F|nr:PEP-utilizing enzyme [Candidatus Solirubrobacter pratensis]